MTSDHLSRDTLGSYSADLLAPTQRGYVEQHLGTCEHCSGRYAEIERVRTALSDLSSEPLAMPPDVWQQLRATVQHEADQRASQAAQGADSRASGPRRPGRLILSVAAAALVAAGAGVAIERSQSPSRQASSASAGGAFQKSPRAHRHSRGDTQRPHAKSGSGSPAPALSPANVGSYARHLAKTAKPSNQNTGTFSSRPQAATRCESPAVPASSRVIVVRWQGATAVLVVQPPARRVRILDCRTGTRVLYSASY